MKAELSLIGGNGWGLLRRGGIAAVLALAYVAASIAVAPPAKASDVSLHVPIWEVDSNTGRVNYDLTVNGTCTSSCSWKVQGYYLEGQKSQGTLVSGTSTGSPLNPMPFSRRATAAAAQLAEITHLKATVTNSDGSTQSTGWIAVSSPYPDGSVGLTVNAWERNTDTGKVTYDLDMAIRGAGQYNGACEYECKWKVQAAYVDETTEANVTTLGSGYFQYQTVWAFDRKLAATAQLLPAVTHIRATLESYYASTREKYSTGWIFVGDHMINDKDLVPYSAALAATFAANRSTFCEPLLLKPYPNANGNSLNDIYESCEAMILGGAGIGYLLGQLAKQIPDTVDELIDYWEKNPAPSEEDRAVPAPPPPSEDDPDCVQEIKNIEKSSTVEHIEASHKWGAGEGESEFYPWADWRWLVNYSESRVRATPSGDKCQRVVSYEPSPVGVIRFRPSGGEFGGEPTHVYTVVTQRNGDLWTTYPGTLGD